MKLSKATLLKLSEAKDGDMLIIKTKDDTLCREDLQPLSDYISKTLKKRIFLICLNETKDLEWEE